MIIDKAGAYMIGDLLISIVAGVASVVAFTVLRMPFSVPLAFVVALFDLIPVIGATLGAIAGVLVTLFAADLWGKAERYRGAAGQPDRRHRAGVWWAP